MSNGKLFSFGLVADVQYADLEDGLTEGRTQRYREAPGKLELAVEHWLGRKQELSFILSLGDCINGNNLHPERNTKELEEIACRFDRLVPHFPVYHAIGNHCLSVPRDQLMQRLKLQKGYYAAQLPGNWKLLVLDSTEMSGHSNLPQACEAAKEAAAFKESHPLNFENPQMADWNGGISKAQLKWLQSELQQCVRFKTQVVVAAHHQAGKGAARDTHLAWNWREIQALLSESQVVRLYLAGHDHMGGYVSNGGVHWLTAEGLLEAPSGGNAFAVLHVYNNRLEVEGHGITSRILPLPNL